MPDANQALKADEAEVARPSVDTIRLAIARIATSSVFVRSPQLVSFLSFIIEEELAGRGERIKGYTIGIHALGRTADFDPNADPIVRVEARRLRQALKTYYASEGQRDDLVIDLPIGSYRPLFTLVAPDKIPPFSETAVPEAAEPTRPQHANPERVSSEPAVTSQTTWILKLILVVVFLNQLLLISIFLFRDGP